MTNTFEYHAPASVDAVLTLLSNASGKLIAGGTDVLVQMKIGSLHPAHLIDIGKITSLQAMQEGSDRIRIGAGITHRQMINWAGGSAPYGALAQASASVGTPQVRNRATVVGNLCSAVPSADLAAPVLLFHAEVVIQSARGIHQVPADEFFTGPKKTVLQPDELVTALLLKPPPARSVSTYQKLGPRKASDLATVGVAALLELSDDNTVRTLRLGLNAVAPTPILVPHLDQFIGQPFAPALIAECAALAGKACRPITDYRASAEYRKEMVESLAEKSLSICAAKLGKEVS